MTNSLTNLDFHVYVDVDVNFYLSSATMPNVQANWKSSFERIKEKVYVNPTWANQNPNPGVIQTNELKWLVAQLHSDRGGDLPNMLFCIFCILNTSVLIPPVHLLWVGNARLRCSSGHDRPLPLPQEGLHFLIILRSQRTPSFKPKMKQR